MAATIIAGTIGNPDWTYVDANPLSYANNIDAYQPYNSLGWLINYSDLKRVWDNTTLADIDEYAKSMYSKLGVSKESVTFYKCAFLHEKLDNGNEHRYEFYYNQNGEIKSGAVYIDDVMYYPLMTAYPKNKNFDIQWWGANRFILYDSAFADHNVGDLTWRFPVFDLENEDRMKEWLGVISTDYEAYGGYTKASVDSEPVNPDEVADPIEGVSDYEGMGSSDGMVRMFTCDNENYKNLGTLVGSGWMTGNIGDAIISNKIIRLPGTIPGLTAEQVIINPAGRYSVSGSYITKQIVLYELGTYKFSENFNNFFDYAPYTQLQIYLPYCGLQRLDPEVVMGNTIKITAAVDLFTGNVIYYCEVQSKEGNSTLYTWNGNCAIDVAITAEDYGRKVTALIGMAGTVAATVATGGVGGAIAAASGAATFANDSSKHMITGSISSNNGFSGIQYPYIVVTKPRPVNVTKYGHNVGYRCNQTYVLGELSGYTVVENVHLENMGDCTIDELKEIESLLKEGVIF